MTTLVVLAKAPVAGRSKTRLTPPCTPREAADLAEAALADTLDAVLGCSARRHVLVLDGEPGPWLPPGIEVLRQRGDGLDERLASAFADIAEPALVVGMDTPQVTPALLDDGLAALDGTDAVLGPAEDGGYWAVGLRHVDDRVFLGIPMSRADTFEHQWRRLAALGRRPVRLPTLRDVDRFDDAVAVAALAPGSRFATQLSVVRDRHDRATHPGWCAATNDSGVSDTAHTPPVGHEGDHGTC